VVPPLSLSLRPSYYLATAFVLAHVLAGAAIAGIGPPFPVTIGSWFAIAANCGFAVYRFALLRSARSIVGFELREKGEATFVERGGRAHEGHVSGSSFVAPYLTVLNFRANEGRAVRHALILPDSLDPDEFRRLRVRLRWECSTTTAH
jgi:toxin CptA